jgi:hypothetical protein
MQFQNFPTFKTEDVLGELREGKNFSLQYVGMGSLDRARKSLHSEAVPSTPVIT